MTGMDVIWGGGGGSRQQTQSQWFCNTHGSNNVVIRVHEMLVIGERVESLE